MSDANRRMNDSTLPPPSVDRSVAGSGEPAVTNNIDVPSARHKLFTKKGFGLTDWLQLTRTSSDLAMRRGQPLRTIAWDEIRQHNSRHDGWTVLKGKVYMISPYLAYHPGGDLILRRILGRDATELFEKYHRWVNEDGLIGVLLIGYVDTSATAQTETKDREGFSIPTPKPPKVIDNIVLQKTSDDERDEVLLP